MNGIPMIERIQLTRYRFPFDDVGYDLSFAMGAFYDPGKKGARSALGIRIHTDEGVTGEYVSIAPATFEQINMFAPFLIGKNALERERFYNQAKVILRKNDRMGIGPVDIALWDLAGKLHHAPVYRLLGGYREDLPTYASTYHADRTAGGLDCPEAFADFAEQCLEMGYQGFKIHSWGEGPISQEVATVQAVETPCWGQDGVDDRPVLRIQHICGCSASRACLRRRGVLLVRGSAQRRRRVAIRARGSCAAP